MTVLMLPGLRIRASLIQIVMLPVLLPNTQTAELFVKKKSR